MKNKFALNHFTSLALGTIICKILNNMNSPNLSTIRRGVDNFKCKPSFRPSILNSLKIKLMPCVNKNVIAHLFLMR